MKRTFSICYTMLYENWFRFSHLANCIVSISRQRYRHLYVSLH